LGYACRIRDILWQLPPTSTLPFVCNEIWEYLDDICSVFLYYVVYRAALKYYFSINICIAYSLGVRVGVWVCLGVWVCVALLWQSVHINMSVLFTCRLLLWPMPTTTTTTTLPSSSSFLFLSGCDLCACICYYPLPLSFTYTHSHTHTLLYLRDVRNHRCIDHRCFFNTIYNIFWIPRIFLKSCIILYLYY